MITFVVLALVMLVGALGVVLLRNPVHAALSLVGTLLTLAIAYVVLNASFLAAIQVIVYAGAIMVLFLFVIMLLNVGGEAPAPTQPWIQPAAWAVGIVVVGALAFTILAHPGPALDRGAVAAVLGGSGVEEVADQIFGPFLLSFHLVGALLLTGIVAAVGLVQERASKADAARAAAGQAGRRPPEAPPMPAVLEETA